MDESGETVGASTCRSLLLPLPLEVDEERESSPSRSCVGGSPADDANELVAPPSPTSDVGRFASLTAGAAGLGTDLFRDERLEIANPSSTSVSCVPFVSCPPVAFPSGFGSRAKLVSKGLTSRA
jgi:hypothetical protein